MRNVKHIIIARVVYVARCIRELVAFRYKNTSSTDSRDRWPISCKEKGEKNHQKHIMEEENVRQGRLYTRFVTLLAELA